jgi:aminopeptidase N
MKYLYLLFLICLSSQLFAQESTNRKDTLQGGLREQRTCYDVLRYDLNIKINIEEKSIVGYNEIKFKVKSIKTNRIQIDLFKNMKVDSIVFDKKKLNYQREFNAVFVEFENSLIMDDEKSLRFYYSGNPTIAKNAPWDGGFVYKKDSNGNDFVGVACQGTGASLWFPCKDSQSDEPDNGASIKVAVPNGLMNVSNGRWTGSEDLKNGYTRWDWEVKNPINSYDITINIGDYIHFGEIYKGLDLDFYVLRENEAKAKTQFEQVKPMMDCFQSKFGKYPFPEDGYKLVETSYLGMEHQSAVAYGNKFLNGYLGNDLSGTGVGLTFDFIIIHESGHEWFGNSITSKDIADMWIHEGFTCYSESVYLECQFGYEKSQIYINGLKKNVDNDKPIIGQYGVNKEGSGDMYYKGALLLNTIRSVIDNDDLWWKIIFKYSETYKHQIIDLETVVQFFNKESNIDLTTIFDQYLKFKNIPILEIKQKKKSFQYRWKTDITNFNMPIELSNGKQKIRLFPTQDWKKSNFKYNNSVAESKFFIEINQL